MFASGCLLQIGVLGLNHKTAPLPLREAMAKSARIFAGEKALFLPFPLVLLSTCNRTEFYFGGSDLAAIHGELLAWLRKELQEPFEHKLYSYFGLDCFSHLARVTAGLDSAILGETEIQGQVKEAYLVGAELGKLPACMHYVFQKALRVGKKIRNQLQVEGSALPSAVWELGKTYFKGKRVPKILLVGHSRLNRSIGMFFARQGVKELTIATRYPDDVSIPGAVGVERGVVSYWNQYDWVIAASASDAYLIEGAPRGEHLLFDLSIPRNMDPRLGEALGITLYNVEQVSEWIRQKRADRVGVGESEQWLKIELRRLARAYREKLEFATTSKILHGQGI